MDLAERAVFMMLGGALGFVLGYIVRSLRDIQKDVHEVRDKTMGIDTPQSPDRPPLTRPRDDVGAIHHLGFQQVALFLVVLMVAYAALVSQVTSNKLEDQVMQDKIARCQSGPEARNVTRELVEAIYKLATGNLKRTPDSPPLTKSLLRQYNDYIKNVNDFRAEMYDKIKPSEDCAPYVDDDNVKPPSDPYPLMTMPKAPSGR